MRLLRASRKREALGLSKFAGANFGLDVTGLTLIPAEFNSGEVSPFAQHSDRNSDFLLRSSLVVPRSNSLSLPAGLETRAITGIHSAQTNSDRERSLCYL